VVGYEGEKNGKKTGNGQRRICERGTVSCTREETRYKNERVKILSRCDQILPSSVCNNERWTFGDARLFESEGEASKSHGTGDLLYLVLTLIQESAMKNGDTHSRKQKMHETIGKFETRGAAVGSSKMPEKMSYKPKRVSVCVRRERRGASVGVVLAGCELETCCSVGGSGSGIVAVGRAQNKARVIQMCGNSRCM
jgi:hypothetical protein